MTEREQTESELRLELKEADVVCLVYSVDDEDTLDRISGHW